MSYLNQTVAFLLLALLPSAPAFAELLAVDPASPVERTFSATAPDTLSLLVSLRSGTLSPSDRLCVSVSLAGSDPIRKTLHAGDSDLWLPLRPHKPGPIRLSLDASGSTRPLPVQLEASPIPLDPHDRPALETEPNDDWQHANPLVPGRDIHGSADDVDFLHNPREGTTGLDWYHLEVSETHPALVFFHLDVPDRDLSADLRLYTLDDLGRLQPYESGKDPMETIHDRERVRYSTHLSRILLPGKYFLRVNANHPSYVLRTRVLPVPPYDDPRQAADVGLHYLQNAGDAWFSQIPREGNRVSRSISLHETATRCTACHAAAFPLDASLFAHERGYPIRNKNGLQHLDTRLRASLTPLPGFDDLHWQRFIATPLESQGLQGGLVADFDRQIAHRSSDLFDRFVPFLRSAWSERTSLPDDERNGVVPLDSKFELAWRDWQVLSEHARLRGDRASFEAARTIENLVADPASDLLVMTLQDRLHRLLCWWLFDFEANSGRIFDESEALFRLQNPDGGWHEIDGQTGPSADYATGQVAWTLLQVGTSPDDPRIQRALSYLLARQQPFGGWFQTSTHENFRTPMRETRFAVMALAAAHPLGEPQTGWGTRDGQPPHPPRSGSLVQTLDDLENLWDRPESDAEADTLERSVMALLRHPEPLVRARAAAALGRIGSEHAISSLVGALDDPSKIVVRASAASLRRLGQRGLGADALVEALASRDPLIARGASFVFAHPFPGLDHRLDLATRLLLLSDSPDLWTRLNALRGLRQWFYRTPNPALQRRIVYAFLNRMADETDPILRQNLSQNLYILLDENLGGGVSLQRNLEALPDPLRARALSARLDLERRVLLGPILGALSSASDRQRAAILAAFDGSLFPGRTYARRPTNQIDVGNDREFGFLSEPPLDLLETAFAAVFQAETRPLQRTQAIELAEFFRLPGRTSNPSIQRPLLDALSASDPLERRASAQVVASSLSLRGLSQNPDSLAYLLQAMNRSPQTLRPIAQALARSPETLTHPPILHLVRRLLNQEKTLLPLLPVLADPAFSPEFVLDALRRAGPLVTSDDDALALLDVLSRRLDLLDAPDLADPVQTRLRLALQSPSTRLRQKALSLLAHRSLRDRAIPPSLILLTLRLSDPDELSSALSLLKAQPDLLALDDVREHLGRLVLDPSAPVRSQAREILVSAGLDADMPLTDRPPPRFSVFRDRINPLFYRPGPDGVSCADCHVNHSVLRLAEAPSSASLSESDLRLNYASALRVVNRADPSASLLLRKPISPPGQGDPDPDSPTGLTHVGGPRWSGPNHPAYREILHWLRDSPPAESPLTTGPAEPR